MTPVPQIQKPFFIFNPKSYLYGQALLELAIKADQVAKDVDMTVMVTAPFADLATINAATQHIIVSAQHIDSLKPGRGMGQVLGESIYAAGARATFLNHAEKPVLFSALVKTIARCRELGILSIVCADSVKEAQTIAQLRPDILLCEPTELIGTGQTSDHAYIKSTSQAIKAINPEILVMQAAGISTPEDVAQIIALGADGTGCTSGILKADNPAQMLEDMILAAYRAYQERG